MTKIIIQTTPGYEDTWIKRLFLNSPSEAQRKNYLEGEWKIMKAYIVWNETKTEGFVTTDKQLAYEVRKGSTTNCYYENGEPSFTGQEFSETWCNDNCTIQEIDI